MLQRSSKDVQRFSLPPCPTPRTGDRVIWWVDAMEMHGTMEGHKPNGRPVVRSDFNNVSILHSFASLRLEDPSKPSGPNWFRLPTGAVVLSPMAHEVDALTSLLAQRIPPGPAYKDLVTEIWARGYEVFLVGGTVRDVLAGQPSHDVDLVTTMPLRHAKGLLRAMYRRDPSIDEENGFVRLGGAPGGGVPFIDLKMFSQQSPGTPDAMFGSEFAADVAHRDFACNAIYYDPVNEALIDPTGRGIVDAESRQLSVVCDKLRRSPYHLARIVVRFFKFRSRGFSVDGVAADEIRKSYIPCFPVLTPLNIISYIRTQILGKAPKSDHEGELERFRLAILDFGEAQLWEVHIAPHVEEILDDSAD